MATRKTSGKTPGKPAAGETGKGAAKAAKAPAKAASKPAARTAAKAPAKALAKAVAKVVAKAAAQVAPRTPDVKPARAAAKAVASAKERAVAKAKAPARKLARAVAEMAEVVEKAVKKAAPRKAAPRKSAAPKGAGRRARSGPPAVEGLDPDGFFVARVRGEEAARQAPHPMTEGEEREDPMALRALAEVPVPADDEGLGDLPWSYGDDVFVGLPRDPRTMFFYWDHSEETRKAGFEWLDRPRAQLRVLALRGDGEWETVRVAEFALESRGFYVHDLEPGRTYRGVIVAVSRDGRERMVGEPSNEVALPSSGPSPVVDDRFATIPWELPLEEWLRDVRTVGAFPEGVREMLSRISRGRKPSRPAWEVRTERTPDPERPSSPTRAWGGKGRRGGKEGA